MSFVFDNLSTGGGTGGGGTFSGGMSTLGNTAGTTGMVNGQLVFVGGSNISLSQSINGQSATITFNGGAGGTGLTNIKVSADTLSQLRSDLTFSNSNGVSFGLNTNGVITATVQTNYLTTAMASNRGSDFVQATAAFNGTNASGTIASNAISVSVAAPIPIATAVNAVASANSTGTVTRYAPEDHKHAGVGGIGISTSGNTAGTTGSEVGTYWFQGGNNVTLSQITSNNGSHTLVISGPNTAAQTNQSAIKGFGVSNTGNTAGNTGISTGIDWVLAGSGSLTLSQSTAVGGPDTVWIQHPAWITTAASSLTNIRVSAGTTSNLLSALTFSDANGVSWGLNASTITATVKTDYLTIQTNQTLGLYMSSNTTSSVSSGTVNATAMTFRGMGIASVGYSGGEVIVSVPSGGGGLTNIRVSAGTTSNLLSALTFADSNGVSWGINASTITATVSTYTPVDIATQVYAVASANSTGTVTRWAPEDHHHAGIGAVGISTSGNTAGTTGSEQGTYWFEGGTNITLSQITSNNGSHTLRIVGAAGGGAAMTFSAGTLTETLASLVFSDSNGVSFGLNGSTLTATVSTYSTVGTATTVKAVASANSVGTITRWAAEDHAHAGIGGIGISTAGNSSGTSGSQVGTYWLQGGSNITISQITSNNGSHTAIISGPTPATMSMWPYPLPASTATSTYYSGSTSQGAGGGSTQTGYTFSLYVVPMDLPAAVAFSELRLGVSNSRSTASTGSVTQVYSLGFYTNNLSTLSLVKGYYGGLAFTQNSITAQTWNVFTVTTGSNSVGGPGGFAGLQSGTVYSSQGNISANSQMEPNLKFIRVDNGAATTLPANQYYAVLGFCSVSSGGNVYANVGILQSNAISTNNIADLGRENSTQTSNYLPAWGAISTTFTSVSNAATFFPLPNAINIANMTVTNSSGQRFHFPYLRNHT